MMMMNYECMIMDKKYELFCNFQVIVNSEGIYGGLISTSTST